jgi:hypothetical protein
LTETSPAAYRALAASRDSLAYSNRCRAATRSCSVPRVERKALPTSKVNCRLLSAEANFWARELSRALRRAGRLWASKMIMLSWAAPERAFSFWMAIC